LHTGNSFLVTICKLAKMGMGIIVNQHNPANSHWRFSTRQQQISERKTVALCQFSLRQKRINLLSKTLRAKNRVNLTACTRPYVSSTTPVEGTDHQTRYCWAGCSCTQSTFFHLYLCQHSRNQTSMLGVCMVWHWRQIRRTEGQDTNIRSFKFIRPLHW